MKKDFFIASFAIAAIAMGAAFSAFTPSSSEAKLQEKWFQYNGSGSVTQASNYGNPSDTDPGCEDGTDQVCAIKAMPSANVNQPQIDGTLAQEINDALLSPEERPEHIQLRQVQ